MKRWDGVGRAPGAVARLGHLATFFVELIRACPAALRRPYLVVAQIHAIGNLSLVIILSSGLAVGFVLALQMYYALVTYGAAESLGLIVNLSLTRELGPVVTALLFAGRAGTSLTAEIGLMKAGEQLAAMDMMAVDPRSRVLAPRFLAGIVRCRSWRSVILGRNHRRYGRRGLLIGSTQATRSICSRALTSAETWQRLGKSIVFGFICNFSPSTGIRAKATPEGVARERRGGRDRSIGVLRWTSS